MICPDSLRTKPHPFPSPIYWGRQIFFLACSLTLFLFHLFPQRGNFCLSSFSPLLSFPLLFLSLSTPLSALHPSPLPFYNPLNKYPTLFCIACLSISVFHLPRGSLPGTCCPSLPTWESTAFYLKHNNYIMSLYLQKKKREINQSCRWNSLMSWSGPAYNIENTIYLVLGFWNNITNGLALLVNFLAKFNVIFLVSCFLWALYYFFHWLCKISSYQAWMLYLKELERRQNISLTFYSALQSISSLCPQR